MFVDLLFIVVVNMEDWLAGTKDLKMMKELKNEEYVRILWEFNYSSWWW